MALDPRLVAILACPDEKSPLLFFEADGFFYCPGCRRRYDVADDIPDMLLDDATVVSEEDGRALEDRARAEGIGPNWSPSGRP